MFDLEAAIANWRREAVAGWTRDRAALVELEDHLREEVSALQRAGHSTSEAWSAATAKLGDKAALGQEFAKLDRLSACDRAAFALLYAAAPIAAASLPFVLAWQLPAALAQPLLALHVAAVTFGYIAGLSAAAGAAYATLRTALAPGRQSALRDVALKLVRIASIASAALTALGFILGAAWAKQAWGQPFDGDPKEIGAILVVVSCAAAGLIAWRSERLTAASLAIAVASGGVILAAWFGAAAQAHSYPVVSSTIGFGGLAASLLLAGLALVAGDPAEGAMTS